MKKLVAIFIITVFASCASEGPVPFNLGKEACSFCKMQITDARFGAEIITVKGKVYKFDDMHCLFSFLKENTVAKADIKDMYAVNFSNGHNLIKVDEKLLLYKSDLLQSPMNGNIAAFDNSDSLASVMKALKGGLPLNWDELIK
jgi:copper chaperone NosL